MSRSGSRAVSATTAPWDHANATHLQAKCCQVPVPQRRQHDVTLAHAHGRRSDHSLHASLPSHFSRLQTRQHSGSTAAPARHTGMGEHVQLVLLCTQSMGHSSLHTPTTQQQARGYHSTPPTPDAKTCATITQHEPNHSRSYPHVCYSQHIILGSEHASIVNESYNRPVQHDTVSAAVHGAACAGLSPVYRRQILMHAHSTHACGPEDTSVVPQRWNHSSPPTFAAALHHTGQ